MVVGTIKTMIIDSSLMNEKVESIGYKVLKLNYFITYLVPFIPFSKILSNFISHGKSNSINSKAQAFKEIEINPILNSYLYLFLELKLNLLYFFSFIFGRNLLLVAIRRRNHY
jgi:hypothetical protein